MLRHIMAAIAALILGNTAAAQGLGVEPGDRVKIRPWPGAYEEVLIVTAVDSINLVVRGERTNDQRTVAVGSLAGLQRSRRSSAAPSRGRGALYGFAAGAAGGMLLGSKVSGAGYDERAIPIMAGGVVGGIAGAATGVFVVHLRRERWEDIPLPPRIAVFPVRGGAATALWLPF